MEVQNNIKDANIEIRGLVQGIGYRPFVARSATELGLKGWVKNTSGIVTVRAVGQEKSIEEFIEKLKCGLSIARVDSITVTENVSTVYEINSETANEMGFRIIESDTGSMDEVPSIPTDIAICDRCKEELLNPENRRYRHPFISCTECGPRYSIIERLPYDRDKITMRKFTLCPFCSKEYTAEYDIRRHAQTIACKECGPRLRYTRIEEKADLASTYLKGKAIVEEDSASAHLKGKAIAEEDSASAHLKGKVIAEEDSASAHLKEKVISDGPDDEGCISSSLELLKRGGILALKDIGGYHLACDATNASAVRLLRALKHRETKPFAVMFENIEQIESLCEMNSIERKLLNSAIKPIVLLHIKVNKKDQPSKVSSSNGQLSEEQLSIGLAPEVCCESPYIGAMLPCNAQQVLLLNECSPLVMTSANISGDMMITDDDVMVRWMREAAKYTIDDGTVKCDDTDVVAMDSCVRVESTGLELAVLSNDRPILTPLDDSIYQVVEGRTQLVRRGRGLVPELVQIETNALNKSDMLAMGGDLKATFALCSGNRAVPCANMGDLDEEGVRATYNSELKRMKSLLGIEPMVVVSDCHPGYVSVKMASEAIDKNIVSTESLKKNADRNDAAENDVTKNDVTENDVTEDDVTKNDVTENDAAEKRAGGIETHIQVYHHHAHIASVMAEHGLNGKVLGVALDGTGYGKDGTVWGSEFLLCEGSDFERIGHLHPVILQGGDAGAKNAENMALAYMWNYGLMDGEYAEMLKKKYGEKTQIVSAGLKLGINSVKSSSMGRLFDAVSALLGICMYNSYEGEAPQRLQYLAESADTFYQLHIDVKKENGELTGDCGQLLRDIADVLLRCENAEEDRIKARLARGFIYAVADYVTETIEMIMMERGLDKSAVPVALSGGTWLNRILLSRTLHNLENSGYVVYINEQVPPTDGGICLGQIYVAGELLKAVKD